MSDERAVSSVLGVVMILGITLAAVTSLMVIGGVALQQSQDEAELSRMETSMAQMSSKASLTALGDAGSQQFDVGDIRDGSLEVQEDSGSITIEYAHGTDIPDDDNTTEIFHTESFGALVYSSGDTEIAYQGGGVWKNTGNGGEMISPPEYHYRDETLTFPIININGDGSSENQGTGEVRKTSHAPVFPNDDYPNPLDNKTVYIEVESEYHGGWYEFFQSRSDGLVEHDLKNQSVRTELTAIYEDAYRGALSVQGSYDIHQNTDDTNFFEGDHYPSPSTEIDRRVADCTEENFNASETSYEGTTTYCAPPDQVEFDLQGSDHLEIATGGKEVDVVLPGGVDFDGGEVVISGGGHVNFYSKDVIEFGNAEINQGPGDNDLSIYVHSDVDLIQESGNFDLDGIMYGPNTAFEFSGNVDIHGAIIADSIVSDGNAASYTYDESLAEENIDFDHAEDEVRFLHITENEITLLLN